jgi:hypothetical protein
MLLKEVKILKTYLALQSHNPSYNGGGEEGNV